MDNIFFLFLNLTHRQNENEIKKIKEKENLIKQETKLKNMITTHIDTYQTIEKDDVEDYEKHIKNTCIDLMDISSYMKKIGIHCKDKDIENQIRNYTRNRDIKRKLFLETRREDLEQRFNVMFLLKETNIFVREDKVYFNEVKIDNYGSIVVSKNTYTLNLGKLKFAFVKNNVYEIPITVLEGEVSKEIETYENDRYNISKQKLIFYSGKMKFTVEKFFKNMSFLIDGKSIDDGYNKIIFSSEKVL